MENNIVDILLVEDNPNDAEMTMRSLRKNYVANKIYHVEDGVEALDFLFARGNHSERGISPQPKVILLDLKLPRVNGLEVLREIKQNKSTQNIPVVILTSSREESDIVESYNLGVNSYIVKPVDFDKFVESIKHIGLYWLLINQPPTI